MPYCTRCGKEIREDDAFCPKCGAPTGQPGVEYQRDRGSHPGRILAFTVAGLLLLVGFCMIMGGAAISGGTRWAADSEGYITSNPITLSTASYAVVKPGVDIHMNLPAAWSIKPEDIATFRITATGMDPSKQVFIGIAREADAESYLGGVAYDRLLDFSMQPRGGGAQWDPPKYAPHAGGAPSQPPTGKAIWVAQTTGAGSQTLTWTPTSGDYWVVLMNADGSQAVSSDVQVAARIPILKEISNALIAVGIILLLGGGALIYYTRR